MEYRDPTVVALEQVGCHVMEESIEYQPERYSLLDIGVN